MTVELARALAKNLTVASLEDRFRSYREAEKQAAPFIALAKFQQNSEADNQQNKPEQTSKISAYPKQKQTRFVTIGELCGIKILQGRLWNNKIVCKNGKIIYRDKIIGSYDLEKKIIHMKYESKPTLYLNPVPTLLSETTQWYVQQKVAA